LEEKILRTSDETKRMQASATLHKRLCGKRMARGERKAISRLLRDIDTAAKPKPQFYATGCRS
jgi:hypothetical protein